MIIKFIIRAGNIPKHIFRCHIYIYFFDEKSYSELMNIVTHPTAADTHIEYGVKVEFRRRPLCEVI